MVKDWTLLDQISRAVWNDKSIEEIKEHLKTRMDYTCPACNRKSYFLCVDLDDLEKEAEHCDSWIWGITGMPQNMSLASGYPNALRYFNRVMDACVRCGTIFTCEGD